MEERERTLLSGRLIYSTGQPSMYASVVNLTKKGARLHLRLPWPCPQSFDVEIRDPDQKLPRRHKCTLKWQHGAAIGVAFDELT